MKRTSLLVVLVAVAAGSAVASDFDGSRELICAPVTAMDCAAGVACVSGTPTEMGAPSFVRVDAAKKQVKGARRSLPAQRVEKTPEQLLLQGFDDGQAWAIAIDAASGRMYATLTGRDGAITMTGACTPL
jgi:hypothetical protein